MNLKRGNKGFTLIEILIVVAIIGILVAIATPLLLEALQRAKQKRTMEDMRNISVGLECYMVDYTKYPLQYIYIQPYYLGLVPTQDGWGRPWIYDVFSDNNAYSLSSGGKDGGGHATSSGFTHDFDDSITIVNGQFIAYPEGLQTK
jgi:general secretion pathway protein G